VENEWHYAKITHTISQAIGIWEQKIKQIIS